MKIKFSLILLPIVAVQVFVIIANSPQTSTLTCNRVELMQANCEKNSVLGLEARKVSLGQLQEAKAVQSPYYRSLRARRYQVMLFTSSGEVLFGFPSQEKEQMQAITSRINTFLATPA